MYWSKIVHYPSIEPILYYCDALRHPNIICSESDRIALPTMFPMVLPIMNTPQCFIPIINTLHYSSNYKDSSWFFPFINTLIMEIHLIVMVI